MIVSLPTGARYSGYVLNHKATVIHMFITGSP